MIKDFRLTKDKQALRTIIDLMLDELQSNEVVSVTVEPFKLKRKRSLPANSVIHVWYLQISRHTGENVKDVEARCKRDFGLPMLIESDPVSAWMLEKLKFGSLNDAQQLSVVQAMSVTRTFNTAQHSEFRTNMQEYYRQHGIDLEYL